MNMIREIRKIFTAFDNYLFDHIHPFINEVNTNIMVLLSFFASNTFLLPVNTLLALYFLFLKKDKWTGIKVIVVAVGSKILMSLLKNYFTRIRPDHPVHEAASGYSFPSGHAMSAMTFYGFIIYMFVSKIKNPAVRWLITGFLSALILAIGFSRIYLRVHYGSDVIGGFVIGYLWLVVSLWGLNKIEKKSLHEKKL